ncbi:MAG: hypothetical protein P8J79_07285 [Halioglobus sp.]|nr:hypothetical protein [Halioglobus sp.]
MRGRANVRLAVAGKSEAGVALAILMWFLAAMSLLVGSIVMQARMDAKLSGLHLAAARVEAAGDGAIQLALTDLLALEQSGEFSGRSAHYGTHTVGNLTVSVVLTPLSGLIDINTAPEGLLSALFSSIEGMDDSAAYELVTSVVKWRLTSFEEPNDSVGGRFEVPEDLLQVEGVDRDIFEAVQDSIYVAEGASSGVDWVSAPASVLQALGGMNENTVIGLLESRSAQKVDSGEPPAGMDLSYQQAVTSSSYRADALVVLDNAVYLRRRWVDRAQVGADGLPWLFFRTEAVRGVRRVNEAMLMTTEDAYAGD